MIPVDAAPVIAALIAFLGGCAVTTVWKRLSVRPDPAHRKDPVPVPSPDAPPGSRPDDTLLVPPPTVPVGDTDVALWTWMRHEHPHPEGLAQRVVARFYRAAATNPEVASYLHGVDMPVLQRHFVRAFITLADRGLTVGTVRALAERHGHVRNTAGDPITSRVFDSVVAALAHALLTEGVPPRTVEQVARLCERVRAAVTAPPHHCPVCGTAHGDRPSMEQCYATCHASRVSAARRSRPPAPRG